MTRTIYLITLVAFLIHPWVCAQDAIENYPDFEGFTINIQFDQVGNYSFSCLYNEQTDAIYLPLEEIFDVLRIQRNSAANGVVISGFLEGNTKPYEIDLLQKKITFDTIEHELTERDYVLDKGVLMLHLKLFESIFGFNVDFNFRNLTATFKVNFEPPVVRLHRLALVRQSLKREGANMVADTTLARDYHWLKAGMLDWAFTGSQYANGMGENRFNVGIGAEVLGGQTDILLNYSDTYGCNQNQQRYLWRWVDNHSKYIRQVQLGRIHSPSIASILYPVDGFLITNTPSTLRKAVGDYHLSGQTEPDWMVELYINKVLVDFVTANATGFYAFKVPLVYGTSAVVLRFYGPNAEEYSEEKLLYTPYNFLPSRELEYSVTGGVLLDHGNTHYTLGKVNYGLTRWLTLGGGIEYLSSISNNSPFIPFANASLQVVPKLIVSTEYAHHVRTRATLHYSMPCNLALEINYAHYSPGQTAIIYNYREERNVNLSFPYKLKRLNGYAKAGFRQHLYPAFGFNAGEAAFSSNYLNYSMNLGNYFNWTTAGSMNIYSHLVLGWRVNAGLFARLNSQYSYTQRKISSYKVELEKRVFDKGYLTLGYENSRVNNYRSIHLSFRYDLAFMSTSFSSSFTNNKAQFSESVRGSLAFDSGNKQVHADKQNAVGRSGITIVPYVDMNHNDLLDDNEPLANNLSVKSSGGQVISSKKDATVRIIGLEPFTDYQLTMSELGFENLSWHIANKNVIVTADPNQFKRIELSVKPMGEVMGTTMNQLKNPMGRVLLHIKNSRNDIIKDVMTEADGYFSFLGLKPGEYTVEVDASQLARLNLTSIPVAFVIQQEVEGDIVDVGSIVLYDLRDKGVYDVVTTLSD